MADQYRIPQMRMIGKGPDADSLYRAETKAAEALATAAKRLEQLLTKVGVLTPPIRHYRDVRPEAIFTMLESQDSGASLAACLAYLDWYRVNRPDTYAETLNAWRDQRGKEYTITPEPR